MPYVVKDARKRSPFWYAVYRDATGRRVRKSTELTSKSKALAMAHTLQRAVNEARQARLTEARARDLLSEIMQRTSGEVLRVFTVARWFEQFVKQKRKSSADKTFLRHEQMMREFLAFLGPRADLNIAAVTSKEISDFRDYRESSGLAPS